MIGKLTAWISKRLSPMQQLAAARSYTLAGTTAANVCVNEQTALGLAAFFACVRVVAETKASLPLQMFEVKNGRKSRVTQHPVAALLGYQPNDDQTPMAWNECRAASVLCSGNSYAEIVRDNRGEPAALVPLQWQAVEPFRGPAGELLYRVKSSAGTTRILDRSQMLHVPGLGNGIIGYSPVRMHAETLGIALGADRFAATYFGNGVKPSLVLTTPGTLDPETKKKLQSDLDTRYSNDNAHRAIIAEGGLTIQPLSIPMNEAQFLESRIFELQEIARIFRVPPHMIGDLSKATFSNIEAQDLSFEKHTMRPWLVRDEQELNRKLFRREDWGRFYVKHNVDALLRADIATRYEAYKTAILAGFKSRNEIRELEDLDPVEGGDALLLPEAIFGKSGGQQTQPAATNSRSTSSRRNMFDVIDEDEDAEPDDEPQQDHRLTALTRSLLAGLVARELTHVRRHTTPEKLSDFYAKHREIVADKLTPFGDRAAATINELATPYDAAAEEIAAFCTRRETRLDALVSELLNPE